MGNQNRWRDADEATLEAEIERITQEFSGTEWAEELERSGINAEVRRRTARAERHRHWGNAWQIALGWVWLGAWIYALVRSWQTGVGWFIFWLILGPVIIATAIGLLGLGSKKRY
jgi:hypothetical protein